MRRNCEAKIHGALTNTNLGENTGFLVMRLISGRHVIAAKHLCPAELYFEETD